MGDHVTPRSVGICVVGVAEGVVVGAGVGGTVGAAVGGKLGATEGEAVGGKLGAAEGEPVGDHVTPRTVGVRVVGVAEGATEGETVGVVVVGETEGATEGEAVGVVVEEMGAELLLTVRAEMVP